MAKGYQIMEMIKENITQATVNVYAEEELVLLEEIGKRDKSGKKIKCMMVHGIALELVSDCAIFDGAGVDHEDKWEIQFTTNSESGIVEMVDKDVFWKYGQVLDDATAVGFERAPTVLYFWFPEPLPYIKKRLWVGVNSSNITTAMDINFTIYHSYGFVSQFALNRMIATKI